MNNFCTLFDKNFLARGMALYQSLLEQRPGFILWVLCMDDEAYRMLERLGFTGMRLLRVAEVEDARMLAVKPTRTAVEYCWMFSSALPLYILEQNPGIDAITYLDADMYFYAPLDEIFQEFATSSVLLIPHGFSAEHEHREKTSGIYNVGMMTFTNDTNALEALRWWKDRVIEWCFARFEDGKYGDQLYLNDWPARFKGVHVLKHPGANVASWNTSRFRFRPDENGFSGIEKTGGQKFRLIFFHFHGLKIYSDRKGDIRAYPITTYENNIYRHYVGVLDAAYKRIRTIDPSWDYGCAKKLDILRKIKHYITLWLRKKS
ncbi:MAG: hypothetical protein JWO00_444 [Candidatus Parcubacteria bacterium]|nr:hypothetical protein [Candidatus Parcubacteria bacterium]